MVKAIGVVNFYPDRLVDLIDHNEVTPAVNQIETHPFFQRTADQELMREHGVQIESWGPFAEGRNDLFTDPILSEIGEAHGKSVAQVVLRWLIQRGVVVDPEVGPRRPHGARTSTSSTSSSPTTRWRASRPWTPARRCSSTTATRRWSASSAPTASAEHLRDGCSTATQAPYSSRLPGRRRTVLKASTRPYRPSSGDALRRLGRQQLKNLATRSIRTGIRGDPSCCFSDKAGTSAGLRPGNSPALYRAAGADNETAHDETKDMSHA